MQPAKGKKPHISPRKDSCSSWGSACCQELGLQGFSLPAAPQSPGAGCPAGGRGGSVHRQPAFLPRSITPGRPTRVTQHPTASTPRDFTPSDTKTPLANSPDPGTGRTGNKTLQSPLNHFYFQAQDRADRSAGCPGDAQVKGPASPAHTAPPGLPGAGSALCAALKKNK